MDCLNFVTFYALFNWIKIQEGTVDMSSIFDPTSGKELSAERGRHGYVARLVQLPPACARLGGVVVFCGEDKIFYECMHIQNETQDFYKWVAVTSGAQRTFLIPVELVTENELPRDPEPSTRTNCFDAIASALNEIAIGLTRYNILVNPLSFKSCYDSTYVDGKKYYVWNNSYDRAQYVRTKDIQPIEGKPYFTLGSNGEYVTVIFGAGGTFNTGTVYFESTRPIMIPDTTYSAGQPITHRVFVASGVAYDHLTKKELVAKTNEIVDIINTTHAKLDKASDAGSLYDLAMIVNNIIDEVNPFSVPWNNLLTRVEVLEQQMKELLQSLA